MGPTSRKTGGEIPREVTDILPERERRPFAAECKALDAAEPKDVTMPKRQTLVLCLIQRAACGHGTICPRPVSYRARFLIRSGDAVAVLRLQIDRFAADLSVNPARHAG